MLWQVTLSDGSIAQIKQVYLPFENYRTEREYPVAIVRPGFGPVVVFILGESGNIKSQYNPPWLAAMEQELRNVILDSALVALAIEQVHSS